MKTNTEETVIGAITRETQKISDEIQDRFTNLYCVDDFKRRIKEAKHAASDRVPFLLRDIAEMLTEAGVECERGRSVAYYEKKISEVKLPATIDEVNKKIVETLFGAYAYYPRPEEFMRRIVDSLLPSESETESVELRILKQFVKTVNVRSNKKYYSKAFAKLDADDLREEVFDVLRESGGSKADGFALIQGAYNLTKGIFISYPNTKELLFLFAFAFGMKYYPSRTDPAYDVKYDVEKNLFRDYYCDNLARYVYSEDGGASGCSDKEPTGLVINPKNFVDVVFIYCLNTAELSPSEKTELFYSLIDKIKKEWKERNEFDKDARESFDLLRNTRDYREQKLEAVFALSEEKLVEYILSNYYCDFRYVYTVEKSKSEYAYDEALGAFVRYDVDSKDVVLSDHVCIRETYGKRFIAAIETANEKNEKDYAPVETNLIEKAEGERYFVYDESSGFYRRARSSKKSEVRFRKIVTEEKLAQNSCGIFELQFTTKTAFAQYCEIVKFIADVIGISSFSDFIEIDGREYKDSVEKETYDKNYIDEKGRIYNKCLELGANVPDLKKLLEFGRLTDSEEQVFKFSLVMKSIIKRLEPSSLISLSSKALSRTKMIALYYHLYCLENSVGTYGNDEDEWKSFSTVYNDFSDCINPYLNDSGYQEISSKNIYDVFVIFIAYCKINNFLED